MFRFQPMLSVSYCPVDSSSSFSSSRLGSSVGDGVKKMPQMQRLQKNKIPNGIKLHRSRNATMKAYEQSLKYVF